MNNETKNMIIAFTLIGAILFGWDYFFVRPNQQPVNETTNTNSNQQNSTPQQKIPSDTQGHPAQQQFQEAPLAPELIFNSNVKEKRVDIKSEKLNAGLNLYGARLDQASLVNYTVTPDKSTASVDVLSKTSSTSAYFSSFGWFGNVETPKLDTEWNLDTSDASSFEISWLSPDNVKFIQSWQLGEDYMFDVELTVQNNSGKSIQISPYGLTSRAGTPETSGFAILHEGLIGVFNETLTEVDYDDVVSDKIQSYNEGTDWIGFTDKYWLVAMIPNDTKNSKSRFIASSHPAQDALYQADYYYPSTTINSGQSSSSKQKLFVGAKEVPVLDKYEEQGVILFDRSVDFGWYYFLTKPIFRTLYWIANQVQNFGVAILILTVLVRLILFPIAQKSFYSMSKMKKLSPQVNKLRERYSNDRKQLSIEMMALYKKEEIKPLAGCLPILLQLPIFFSLYKVLFVTIEMRHAPFFGWITDLSAPDPSGLLTVFGLVPWAFPSILSILNVGLWPILMGVSMYLQMKLNPTPTDPIQKKIFTYMPIAFTFLLGQMPAGLVIYWTWSNMLSMLQQWVIMRRLGVKIS